MGSNDIYFLAAKKEIRAQIKDISNVINRKIVGFNSVEYPDICSLLESLNRFLDEKITLIFDEFNYLIESNRSILSEINIFWETAKDKKFNIILCGSVRK